MEGKHNFDEQHEINQVQNTTITFPVFISVIGIISVALAVMLYHLLLLRYCRHRHYSDHPSLAQSTSHQSVTEPEGITFGPISWFGLDERALEFIPVLPYCERALDFFRIEQSECVVCLGKLERGERVRWLPGCAHAFHVACIDNWLRSRASCPTCRAPVVVPPPLLRQFVGGAAYINTSSNGGRLTRARSGGTLRRGGGAKVPESDSDSSSVGLKRSLSVDHSCIGIDNNRDLSTRVSSSSQTADWRPTSLVSSILGFMVQDEGRGVLPY